jgi:competence ComEA-like helix-hairpin-helix protein
VAVCSFNPFSRFVFYTIINFKAWRIGAGLDFCDSFITFPKYPKIYFNLRSVSLAEMISRIKNYLSVSKKEWNGMVVLVVLIALVLAAPYIFQLFRKNVPVSQNEINKAIAGLNRSEPPKPATSKATPGVIIELNTADSAKLTGLNGIGPSFARRIISYRNRLGGFVKKEQLLEVFGLDSEKYTGLQAQVSVDASKIKKIPVNTVGFDGLSHFPYLTYKQMNAIIRFREQHGEYESTDDLKNIVIMDDATLQKIKPYLTFK